MKLRRVITRRRAKWVGVIALATGLACWLASYFIRVKCERGHKFDWVQAIEVSHGRMGAYQYQHADSYSMGFEPPIPYMQASYVLIRDGETRDISLLDKQFAMFMDWRIVFPLWLPLLLIAAPTVYLWRTDRRAKPWQCAKCRYDLRGLEGGGDVVCPECGTSTEQGSIQ